MLNETAKPTDSAEQAFRSLIRCIGMVRRVMHPYFEQHGISESQWGVLRVLSRHDGDEGVRIGDLGERLLVRPPSVTGVVSRLEKMGLVKRWAPPDDQRARHVKLTPRGRELLQRILKNHSQRIRIVMDGLEPHEQQQLKGLLDRMSDHLGELAAPAAAAGVVKEQA